MGRSLKLLISLLAAVLCMMGSACVVQQQSSTPLLNFANEARLDEHWRKHGQNIKEFDPVLTKEQYLKRARDFFESKASEMLHKARPNGDALRFRPSTGEFGVLSGQRVIRTYFRPDSGIRYWERQ